MTPRRRTHWQRASDGALAVEFAVISLVFFGVVFGAIELARAMYMVNILEEVTRRAAAAAAVADFSNATTMENIRRAAVLHATDGRLPFGEPVTAAHVRIEAMSIARDNTGVLTLALIGAGNLPANPARNRLNCTNNPYGNNCIRMIRVRICDPADTGTCNRVPYQPLLPLVYLAFQLPSAVTLQPAETLGYIPGATP